MDRVSGWVITNFTLLNYSLLIPSVVNSAAYILVASSYFQQRLNLFGKILVYSFFPLFLLTILTEFNKEVLIYRNIITLPALQLYAFLSGVYTSYLLYKAIRANNVVGIGIISLGTFVLLLNSSMVIFEVYPYISETLLSFSYLVFFFCVFFALSLEYLIRLENERELALNFLMKLEEEVKLKTEDLARSNKELKDANRMRDLLFSIIGHDLRSPLDALKIILNLFHKKKFTLDQLKKHIVQVTGLLESSQLLLENLLHWASTQVGYKEVTISEIDLVEISKESYKLFMYKSKEKDISMRIIANSKLVIYSDKNIIQMTLNNLVSNAIKFTPFGGIVEIQLEDIGTHVGISVADTGIGLPVDPEVFIASPEEYLREGVQVKKNTGLGLRLTKDLLSKLDSQLFCDQNTPNGTIFTFYLKKMEPKAET